MLVSPLAFWSGSGGTTSVDLRLRVWSSWRGFFNNYGRYVGIAGLRAFGSGVERVLFNLSASHVNSGNGPDNLVDGDASTYWETGVNEPPVGGHWVRFTANGPVDEVRVRARPSLWQPSPKIMIIEETSDGGATWSPLWYENDISSWTGGEEKTFTQAAGSADMTIYRLRTTATHGGDGHFGMNQWELRLTPGGSALTGGVRQDRSLGDGTSGLRPENAVDGDTSTVATSGPNTLSGSENFFAQALSGSVSPQELLLRARDDQFGADEAPRDMQMEKSTDGGLTFSTIKTWTGLAAWSQNEARTFSLP